MSRLKNPMRFSISHRSIDFGQFDVDVDELELRPSEGQLYVHWKPPICDTCHRRPETGYRWEDDGGDVVWTCEDHVPVPANNVEAYHA